MTELHPTRDPFEFPMRTAEVSYLGVTYKFQELTLAQNDEIRELATDEKNAYDPRLGMRLTVCFSSVEPKIDMENLAKFPSTLYAKVFEAVNDLHDPDTAGDEDPGKS